MRLPCGSLSFNHLKRKGGAYEEQTSLPVMQQALSNLGQTLKPLSILRLRPASGRCSEDQECRLTSLNAVGMGGDIP
jgi:hypothetical protein